LIKRLGADWDCEEKGKGKKRKCRPRVKNYTPCSFHKKLAFAKGEKEPREISKKEEETAGFTYLERGGPPLN